MRKQPLKRTIANILLWIKVWFMLGYWVLAIFGVIDFNGGFIKSSVLYIVTYLLGQATLFTIYAIVVSKD